LILAELTGDGTAPPADRADRTAGGTDPWNTIALAPQPGVESEPIELPANPAGQPVVDRREAPPELPVQMAGRPQPTRTEQPALELHRDPAPPVAAAIERPAETEATPVFYTVRPGDTLIRIARKVYGPDCGDEYARIYQANQDVLVDESSVYVGQKLRIPPLTSGTSFPRPETPAQASSQVQEMDLEQLRRHFGSGARRSSSDALRPRRYVVRPGDTLIRIARRMLDDGSRSAVRRLFEANQDVLDDPDQLRVGMTLRIPGRTGEDR
jgi:nucleoid-associated protein YgaU